MKRKESSISDGGFIGLVKPGGRSVEGLLPRLIQAAFAEIAPYSCSNGFKLK